jgi:hypothetical protein
MIRTTLLLTVVALAAIPCRAAEQLATPGQLGPNSSLDQILDALYARGVGLKDFTGDVSVTDADTLGGAASTITGKVWFQEQAPGDSRIRVTFDKKQVGQKPRPNFKLEYLLEEGWLIERDFVRKLEVARKVLKPGQKLNLLKLGEGPFPLPIGQSPAEVLKQFEVKKVAPAKEDPASTVHVQLTPKPQTRFARKFKTLDVWVDTGTNFPRRIETLDPNQTEDRTTDLTNIQVNQGLSDQQFQMEKIGNDWTRRTEELTD